MSFWHQTINGRFFVRAARFRSFHDQGVQNLALKTSFDAQKQSNYAKSRAKYSSEIFSATMRDARFFPAYVKSPASAKTLASPVHMRGEDVFRTIPPSTILETPPRAWGRPDRAVLRGRGRGNTPTCVGKTNAWSYKDTVFEKHPHVRGEDRIDWNDIIF